MSFQFEELTETSIAEKYHFLKKKEPVNFDIEGFAYLQTLDGGNRDVDPVKAIAAHVKGFFQYTRPTEPAT